MLENFNFGMYFEEWFYLFEKEIELQTQKLKAKLDTTYP